MRHLDFVSYPADPDLWMRLASKPDGTQYYTYILLYTDDILVIDHHAEHVLRNQLGKYFELKQESIGPPKIYLGGKTSKVELENGVSAWSFSSTQDVKAVVANVKKYVENHKSWRMPSNCNTPLTTMY